MKKIVTTIVMLLCVITMTIIPAFAANTYATIYELFAEWDQNGYPDDVSDVYSVDGGSSLCVLLTHDTPEREAEIRAMLDDDSTVSFGTGSYSYNAMKLVQNEIVEEYMGADSPIVGCGIGWISIDGEVTGFGESGKESRVVVDVLEAQAEKYAEIFYGRYGGMVIVQAGEAAVVADDSSAYGLDLDPANQTGKSMTWIFFLACIALVLTASLCFGGIIPGRAIRTTSGHTITRQEMPSRKQVITAVKESAHVPADEVWVKIRDRIK